jgi:hypothetical protein
MINRRARKRKPVHYANPDEAKRVARAQYARKKRGKVFEASPFVVRKPFRRSRRSTKRR